MTAPNSSTLLTLSVSFLFMHNRGCH